MKLLTSARNSIDLSTTIVSWIRSLSLLGLMIGGYASPSFATAIEEVDIVGRPLVVEDEVTLRVKVTGENGKPRTDLQSSDFGIEVDGEAINFMNRDWKNPRAATPPPAWIILLLDFSGSMSSPVDLNGDNEGTNPSKLQGAIAAIQAYIDSLAERAGNTQISIVPFGISKDTGCDASNLIDKEVDDFGFVEDTKWLTYLNTLRSAESKDDFCAATDLFSPLDEAMRLFTDSGDSRFSRPENSMQPEPRLNIVLLSDGYHTEASSEEEFTEELNNFKKLLERNSNVVIHTLGYGLTPEELGEKCKLGRPVDRSDIYSGLSSTDCTKEQLEKEFVDRAFLEEIANSTGGISEFSGEADEIAQKLEIFLDVLLGEYEITYTEPNPERGLERQVKVTVDENPNDELQPVESLPESYRMGVFWWPVPLRQRLPVLAALVGVIAVGGVLPFSLWAKSIKRQQ